MTYSAEVTTSSVEVATMYDALVWFRGNQSAMSRHLGIERGTIRKRINTGTAKNILLKVIRDGDTVVGFELINRYR